MTTVSRHRGAEGEVGGSDVFAIVVIVPIVFAFVLVVSFWGRQGEAAQQVRHAAAVAARAGALARSRAGAETAARDAVTATLATAATACAGGPQVTVTSPDWAPGGVIRVEVSCTIGTGDLTAIRAPARRVVAVSSAVIDRYRGFTP